MCSSDLYYLGVDSDGSDGFSIVWDTGQIVDFAAMVRATAETVGETSEPKEEMLRVVNIIPQMIYGFSDPATGSMDITVYVTSPSFTSYFPENVWVSGGTGYTIDYGYTVVNRDPANASTMAGTVDQVSTHLGPCYPYTASYLRIKLFKMTTTTLEHIWTSSILYYPNDWVLNGTKNIAVNIPNVPKGTQTGHYVYQGYINYSQSYSGNPTGVYYRSGDISDTAALTSWMTYNGASSPMRARISNTVEPTSAVQLGYSLDGGETFVYYGDCTDQGDGYFTLTFDSAQAGNIAARDFMLAARAFNGAVWCSWTPSDPFTLTNLVDVTVRTSLSSGGQVTVDGATTDVFEDTWYYFEPHAVSAPQYLNVTATSRDVFDSWSDGGARSHNASIENTQGATLVATFARESYLTIVSALSYVSGDQIGRASCRERV